ncbi:MAG TPA: hypothetical protein ENI83_02595 [Gammaproteobacteria bacterium]|uniref:Lipoprotein SmpA/OmlA domain-containing protein n=1 Tax=hydrothermal vent metagenome TaxID=652676 RepID=A0A3B0YW55_9ZZZZ|nr:hypothetical protein [Gammaproteobacteria bacterium]
MRPIRILFLLSLVSGLFFQPASADTLLVESVQSAPDISRPARGLTMDQVIQHWGEPQQRVGPVGEPPISHWVYPDFVVYFESDYVLHSVVPHSQ